MALCMICCCSSLIIVLQCCLFSLFSISLLLSPPTFFPPPFFLFSPPFFLFSPQWARNTSTLATPPWVARTACHAVWAQCPPQILSIPATPHQLPLMWSWNTQGQSVVCPPAFTAPVSLPASPAVAASTHRCDNPSHQTSNKWVYFSLFFL